MTLIVFFFFFPFFKILIPFFIFPRVIGYAHMEFGAPADSTELRVKQLHGDKTGWLHVRPSQTLRAQITEGLQGSLFTTVNLNVSRSATLHVPLNLTVDGTSLVLGGLVTFNNLVLEEDALVQLKTTSQTGSFEQGAYRPTSDPGCYLLGLLALKHGSRFEPEADLCLRAGLFEMKRFVTLTAENIDVRAGTVILQREARLDVSGKSSGLHIPPTANASRSNGGAHASEGGVGQGQDLSVAAEPFGSIYEPASPGGFSGGMVPGGGVVFLQADEVVLDGVLDASGASSPGSGGGGAGGSVLLKVRDMLKGFGKVKATGGDTVGTDSGAGSGGRIAAYTGSVAFLLLFCFVVIFSVDCVLGYSTSLCGFR